MRETRDYDDIPGTYIFDGEHSRAGYHLNMFCMSLNEVVNRQAFADNQSTYLDRYPMTVEQKTAVLDRDWLAMLRLGGSIRRVGTEDVVDVAAAAPANGQDSISGCGV